MKTKISTFAIVAGLSGSLSAATLVDDFSGGLAAWTQTTILDVGGSGSNDASFAVDGSGDLVFTTTTYDNIEQYAFILNGASLAIGEEAQIDIDVPLSGNRNLGLFVGGTAPVFATNGMDTRVDNITNYSASNGAVATRGQDGTSEYGNTQVFPTAQTLFIARSATNTFEVGYYDSGARTVYETRNPSTPNSADFIGIYADARAAGTVGAISEFRIVPEPSSVLLVGLGCLGAIVRRRR